MLRRVALALCLLSLCCASPASAQTKPQQNTQPEPTFEPFKAEKSVEVGMFYLKKKNYDAAIERFLDAVRYKPGYARPHFLLGRAFEGKREWEEAILHYNAYLEILPNAEDAKKVRKKITSLEKKVEREKARKSQTNRGG